MRKSVRFPGSVGDLLKSVVMNLRGNSAWFYFSSRQVQTSCVYQESGTMGGDK